MEIGPRDDICESHIACVLSPAKYLWVRNIRIAGIVIDLSLIVQNINRVDQSDF
jgi:hypothetical protein